MNHLSHKPNPRKSVNPSLSSVSPKYGLPSFCNRLTSFRNNRVDDFGLTETGKFLSWLKSDKPRWYFRSHRKPQRSLYLNFRYDRVFTSVSPRLFNYVCNGWILCGGYIYPSTPSSFVRRAIRKYHHFYHTLSEKWTTYPCVEIKPFHSYHMRLDF